VQLNALRQQWGLPQADFVQTFVRSVGPLRDCEPGRVWPGTVTCVFVSWPILPEFS